MPYCAIAAAAAVVAGGSLTPNMSLRTGRNLEPALEVLRCSLDGDTLRWGRVQGKGWFGLDWIGKLSADDAYCDPHAQCQISEPLLTLYFLL